MTEPAYGPTTTERFGRPFRHFSAAVSATAMALAWSHKENGPHGATVLVDHEVSALGRLGIAWTVPAADTLACAVVLRPPVASEAADLLWLVGALGLAEAIEAVSDRRAGTWWPDSVIDATGGEITGGQLPGTQILGAQPQGGQIPGQVLGVAKADIELGPSRIKAGVVTLRLNLRLLGLDRSGRDGVLGEVLAALDRACEALGEGAAGVAAAYEARCGQIGKRVKIRLRPKGETRGVTSGVDSRGWLQITSATGMVEHITIDMLRALEVVEPSEAG